MAGWQSRARNYERSAAAKQQRRPVAIAGAAADMLVTVVLRQSGRVLYDRAPTGNPSAAA